MPTHQNPFNRCKLCRQYGCIPTYPLNEGTIYRCPHCDFHFLNHLDGSMPEENSILSAAGRGYIEARIDEGAHLQPLRLRLVQQQCSLDGAMTLDIGAGLGQFMLLLQQQGATTRGIEPSALRRTYARDAYNLELSPHLADTNYWQSGYVEAFDLITLWDVIEHVDDPRSTLTAAAALLKPGGMLFLDTPNRDVFSYRFSETICRLSNGKLPFFLSHFYSTIRYGHKQIFTPRQITGLLQQCGLTPDTLEPRGQTKRAFARKIVLAARKP